jgi:hypothetical protein
VLKEQLLEHVAAHPLFASLDREKLRLLVWTSDFEIFHPGTVLFREGDAGTAFYILLQGRLARIRRREDGLWRGMTDRRTHRASPSTERAFSPFASSGRVVGVDERGGPGRGAEHAAPAKEDTWLRSRLFGEPPFERRRGPFSVPGFQKPFDPEALLKGCTLRRTLRP